MLAVLALGLGALAAADVGGREAALRRRIGPSIGVVVVRTDVAAGATIGARALAIRQVPARYAPAAGYSAVAEVTGLRAAVAIPAGTDLVPALLDDPAAPLERGPAPRRGERIVDLVAEGTPALVGPGTHVDVLVTSERPDGSGHTRLALQDAVVQAAEAASGGRVRVWISVGVRAAVRLAAAQNFAREIRVLPRAPGDDGRVEGGAFSGS